MQNIAVQQIATDLGNHIERYKSEYDITAAEMIGILEIVKMDVYTDLIENDGEEWKLN